MALELNFALKYSELKKFCRNVRDRKTDNEHMFFVLTQEERLVH